MKSITAAGRSISYLEKGEGSPLVFLHAFPLGPAQWQPQIDRFSRDWRCLALAAPGLGSDPFTAPPSLAQIGDDLLELLDSLDIHEPIVLCGLSMGGYAAQWFAHRFPEKLRALVLCGTRASADDEATRAKRAENIAFARDDALTELIERLRPPLLGDTSTASRPEVVDAVNRIALRHSPVRISDAIKALRDRPDMKSWLPAISVPTLLIFGDEDKMAPDAEVATLQTIHGSQLRRLPRSGHLSNLETPDAFNVALQDFLTKL